MPYAFATVKIRVACNSSWSKETSIDQISRQAKTDAIGQLSTALKGRTDMKILGEPEISAVHTEIDD